MTSTLTGPVSGGQHGWPFAAAAIDLAGEGYIEEEFFVAGDATHYRPVGALGRDGQWTVESAAMKPFTTRALVRRPSDPARFNGTVIVEWNNVSAGCEIAEAGDTPVVFDEGFAYVGISAQHVGLHGFEDDPHGLVTWDPERYGSLHIADDTLSYGIYAEVARHFAPDRPADQVDPLDGLVVKRLLAAGGSQSAARLVSYINAVHPIERLFNGFIVFTWFGSGSSIDDPAVFNPAARDLAQLISNPTQIRSDLDVPVMVVNSECETLSCFGVRQPDTDRFRFWEVAGAPHGPRLHMERILPKLARDGIALPGGEAIDVSYLSPVPWAPVLDAAIAHVQRWMDNGPPPPQQAPIDVAGDPPAIMRDADGNALGGVRVPEMAVTLSRNVGAMEGSGAAGLMGVWNPLPADVVHDRYPGHADYVAAFEKAAESAVEAGVLLPGDAAAAIDRAKAATLP